MCEFEDEFMKFFELVYESGVRVDVLVDEFNVVEIVGLVYVEYCLMRVKNLKEFVEVFFWNVFELMFDLSAIRLVDFASSFIACESDTRWCDVIEEFDEWDRYVIFFMIDDDMYCVVIVEDIVYFLGVVEMLRFVIG